MATTPAKKPAAKKPAAQPAPKVSVEPEAASVEPSVEAPAPDPLPPVDHAPLVAPPPPAPEPVAPPEPRPADAAVDILTSSRSVAVFCEATGRAPDPGCVFTDPVDGIVTAKCRLIERGEVNSGRKVTRLLLAAGEQMNAAAAERFLARVDELNKD